MCVGVGVGRCVGVDASMSLQAWQSVGLITDCSRLGGHLTLLNTPAEQLTDARSEGGPHTQISHWSERKSTLMGCCVFFPELDVDLQLCTVSC